MSPKSGPLADHLRASAAEGRDPVDLQHPRQAGRWTAPVGAHLANVVGQRIEPLGESVEGRGLGRPDGRTGPTPRGLCFRPGRWEPRGQPTCCGAVMPASPASPTATSTSGHGEVEISVQFSWRAAGRVVLDGQGKPMFDSLPEVAGLYRLTLGGGLVAARRPRIYIGETDRIRRRLAGNYRNAGPTQATSLRINALLREHLRSGGLVELGIATEAWCSLNGRSPAALDLAERRHGCSPKRSAGTRPNHRRRRHREPRVTAVRSRAARMRPWRTDRAANLPAGCRPRRARLGTRRRRACERPRARHRGGEGFGGGGGLDQPLVCRVGGS